MIASVSNGFAGPRAQEAQDAGAQRRLHQGLEARFDVGTRAGGAPERGALRREGHVIHVPPPAAGRPAGAR